MPAAPACRNSSKTNSMPTSIAAFSRTGLCVSPATAARVTRWSRSVASAVASVRRAARDEWEQLQTLLDKIIRCSVKLLTRLGHLIEEEGVTYLARTGDIDPDNVIAPLQAASSTYRIAMGPRAGRKVLSLQNTSPVSWVKPITTILPHPTKLCVNARGFSLHAGVRCDANDAKG